MLIDLIKRARRILIVCHIKPDGDCIGSGLALRCVCERLKKAVDLVSDSEKPEHYGFLKDYDRLNERTQTDYDTVIAVDCADELRLGRYIKFFKKAAVSVNIDHHPTNAGFGKVNLLNTKSSSTCEIIYQAIKNDIEIDADIANWLYTGMSTDTGNFMHNNTTVETLHNAAELLQCGADLKYIVRNLYRSNALRRTKLQGKAIEGLRFFREGSICLVTVSAAMLFEYGCTVADTEGLIDIGNNIAGVELAVCMTEQASKSYKVSFRSKGPNVAEVASRFGGGGHILASGCVVNGHYEDVLQKIVKMLSETADSYDGIV